MAQLHVPGTVAHMSEQHESAADWGRMRGYVVRRISWVCVGCLA